MKQYSVGLVGARGYVGIELIGLIERHPHLQLGFVSSREWAGRALSAFLPGYARKHLCVAHSPEQAAKAGVDVLVLAMPNKAAKPYVEAIDALAPDTLVLDLSADYRFDGSWYYGLPELTRLACRGQRRISNPGCYATAMQLALAPLRGLLNGPAQCFGVSGYSGAGTTPSDKNNPAKLHDNLMPYSLAGHIHEAEVSRHLDHPVEFMPHVAAHFRGISMTVNFHLKDAASRDALWQRYVEAYADEPMVELQAEAPWVSRIAGRPGASIGGLTLSADGRRGIVVCCLDNLLKGAASQALQNINLALGLDEFCALHEETAA
ncbi:N-acetyl-gamma-glutamyl-phosphate reductase [Pseudomarimonas arenosa]